MHTLLSLLMSLAPETAKANADKADVAKAIVSLVVALGGAAATLVGNWNAITEGHTLRTKIKAKAERVRELVALLNDVKETDEFKACRHKLHSELMATLEELDDLRKRAVCKQSPRKNQLTVAQRLFLFFPPRGPHAWLIHLFAYAFMFGGPVVILLVALFVVEDKLSTVSDLVILVVFGALAFRGWALAQRKWETCASASAEDSVQPRDSDCDLFVMRKPRNRYMLAAQISLWISIFCVLESLEDLIFEGIEKHHWSPNANAALILFIVALAVSLLCREWAVAEWRYASRTTRRGSSLELCEGLLVRHSILAGACLASLLGLLRWKWSVVVSTYEADLDFWGDNFDRAEAFSLLLVSILAIIHWVSLRKVARGPVRKPKTLPVKKPIRGPADASSPAT